jgi:hypothetical protein
MNFDDTARFFGASDKLWPELFAPPSKHVIRMCRDCRKREVRPRQKYCAVCAKIRKRAAQRSHMRRKRGHDVEKLANSPTGAEGLTKHVEQGGYIETKTEISASNFSTRKAGVAP